jgi:hypothetical protein
MKRLDTDAIAQCGVGRQLYSVGWTLQAQLREMRAIGEKST